MTDPRIKTIREQLRHLGPHRGAVGENALDSLAADLEAAREALMDLLASDHSTARAKASAALARLSAGKETGDE